MYVVVSDQHFYEDGVMPGLYTKEQYYGIVHETKWDDRGRFFIRGRHHKFLDYPFFELKTRDILTGFEFKVWNEHQKPQAKRFDGKGIYAVNLYPLSECPIDELNIIFQGDGAKGRDIFKNDNRYVLSVHSSLDGGYRVVIFGGSMAEIGGLVDLLNLKKCDSDNYWLVRR